MLDLDMKPRSSDALLYDAPKGSFEALLDDVLQDWSFFAAVSAGRPGHDPNALELEFGIAFKGPQSGVLALRCNRDFANALAQAGEGKDESYAQVGVAFRELCSLVAKRMLDPYLGGPVYRYEMRGPLPCHPGLRPAGQLSAQCALMVGAYPLEARLWIESNATQAKQVPLLKPFALGGFKDRTGERHRVLQGLVAAA